LLFVFIALEVRPLEANSVLLSSFASPVPTVLFWLGTSRLHRASQLGDPSLGSKSGAGGYQQLCSPLPHGKHFPSSDLRTSVNKEPI